MLRLEKALERWVSAGLIDQATAARLRAFEAGESQSQGSRWPVLVAIAFGGVLLGSGILLFVAAHWDHLSPAQRFGLVLLMTVIFHVGGAFSTTRFPALASMLHAVGSVTLGAGIFLAGQIFNLEEHWPGGVMLWAAGALIGWALLRDWPQAALAAILIPAWLSGEWAVAAGQSGRAYQVLTGSQLLLSITYLTARTMEKESPIRRALTWIGGITLIPLVFMAADPLWHHSSQPTVSEVLLILGWLLGFGLPLALAYWLRGKAAWLNLVSALWVVILGITTAIPDPESNIWVYAWHEFGQYVWLWLGAIGLIAWGLREARRELVNLGVASFGITVLAFYFASVMDKLGRSASLIGLGVLFLVIGWSLERGRRRLLARMAST